ncbi:TetR family transcriptional regulator [Skermania sp. ID1734]|uniref:TetR family transcriptional regulator n=1 Tax=Skermania sp. ID1734 TaxID=2597516 RepID=UPI00117E41E5|nr:TetR family transcriptional regulator [Skermania sp. ID1734]TSD98184.1 TetR family transcriptional regulator [Skermania sp. ID1734]
MQLHRNDVLDAAVAILDEYGLADLTMRRLASSLNVQPGALYWHFPNKQTLLAAIADRLLEPIEAPLQAADWAGQLLELSRRLRSTLLSLRDGAELVSASYASRLTTGRARQRFADAVSMAGLSADDAELAAHAFLHYVLGQTEDEQQAGSESDDATRRFEFGVQLLIDGVQARVGDPRD